MEALFLLGRILFAVLFVSAGVNHLTKTGALAQYAAAKKVPAPKLSVLVTGLMNLAGGLSILLGYEPRIGAVLLVIFLMSAAVLIHNFWAVPDPMQKTIEQAMFWKNVSLAGAALMIYYFTALHPEAWAYSLSH